MLRKKQQQDLSGPKASSPRQDRRVRVAMMDTVSDQDHLKSGARYGRTRTSPEVQGRDLKGEKNHLRRSASVEPQYERKGSLIGTSRRNTLLPEREKAEPPRITLVQRPDYSGDRQKTYSFWTSRPALVMLCSLALAIKFKDIKFGVGALLVFLYEVGVVVAKWKGFIVNHPSVTECLELTTGGMKYSFLQAERLVSKDDWTRKAALGVFVSNFGMATSVAGGYLKQRQEEVTKRTLAEVERVRHRLHMAGS
jgi:hypothetical protein